MHAISLDSTAARPVLTVMPDNPAELFAGDGAMRQAFREQDWSATPLGPAESWTPSLRSSVQHILWSDFPNVVLWGPDLLQLYNESYQELMGDRHPLGLGRPTRECSPHDWHINAPIYARVMAGETISRQNALFSIIRSGKVENFYLTLSYSPIYEERAEVGGVLVTVFESAQQTDTRARDENGRRIGSPRDRKRPPLTDRIRRPPISLST